MPEALFHDKLYPPLLLAITSNLLEYDHERFFSSSSNIQRTGQATCAFEMEEEAAPPRAESVNKPSMPTTQRLAVFGIPVEHWVVISAGALVANQLIRTFQLVREEAAELASAQEDISTPTVQEERSDDATDSSLCLPSVRLSIMAALCLAGVLAVILRPLIQQRRRRWALVRCVVRRFRV